MSLSKDNDVSYTCINLHSFFQYILFLLWIYANIKIAYRYKQKIYSHYNNNLHKQQGRQIIIFCFLLIRIT